MTYKDWRTTGTALKTTDEAIWIRQYGTFDAFQWMGRCARLDEGTENLGDLTVTQRLNPRGGLERDSVLSGAPAEATTTLTMKRLQADRKKTDLRNCYWTVDQRMQCGGVDADAWDKWDEIIRYCYGKATERGIPKTAFDGDAEEQLITFPWKSLYVDDIYRVTGENNVVVLAKAAMVTALATCQPERCPDGCDDQEECVVVAVTQADGATSPWISVNLVGGDLDQWGTAISLAAWGVAEHATDVACIGSFVVVTSQAAGAIIYSDDRGTTQVEVTSTDMTAHGPDCVDMIDQSFIVVGGEDGYIFGSYDSARSWETLDAGEATTSDIDLIMICRENPQVIYGASSEADVVVKTENGGRTWFTQNTTGTAGAITALYVAGQSHVLVGTSVGEIYETSDGGNNWTEQTTLPGLTTKANTTVEAICGCGCDSLGLAISNTTDNQSLLFRNVDNGASGKWFQPAEYEAIPAADDLTDMVCCGSSHFIAAGGQTGASDIFVLLR